MADVGIETSATSNAMWGNIGAKQTIWMPDDLVGYHFYALLATSPTIKYRKTTDGGASWGSPVTISTGNTFQVVGPLSVWADWQTPGDSGAYIHVSWIDLDVATRSTHLIHYNNINTASSDALGTQRTIQSTATGGGTTVVFDSLWIDITKTVGGKLACAWTSELSDGTDSSGFEESSDNGATWTPRSSPMEALADRIWMYPGDDPSNTDDINAAYYDASASTLTQKVFDDSVDSWPENSFPSSSGTSMGGVGTARTSITPMANGALKANGRVAFFAWSAFDSASADLKGWELSLTAGITQMTNLVTDKDDCGAVAPWVNLLTGDIAVAVIGNPDGSQTMGTTVDIYYILSHDDGSTWESPVRYSETSDDYKILSVAPSGGRFYPAFFDDDDLDWYGNFVNSFAAAVMIAETPASNEGDPASVAYTPSTLGNLLVAVLSERSGNVHANHTVTDNQENDWIKIAGACNNQETSDPNARQSVSLWYKIVQTLSEHTITGDDGTANSKRLTITEYKYLGTVGDKIWIPKASAAANSGTGSTSPQATGTTGSVAAGDLLVVAYGAWRQQSSVEAITEAGTGWTNDLDEVAFFSAGSGDNRVHSVAWKYDAAGGTYNSSLSWNGPNHECSAGIVVFAFEVGVITLEQEGYRFRDDDDDEDEASWLADQDTPISIAKETPFRVRITTDNSGTAPSTLGRKLQYRRVGDANWRDIS